MQSFTNTTILKNGVKTEMDNTSKERIKYIKKVFPHLGSDNSFTTLDELTQENYEADAFYHKHEVEEETPVVTQPSQELLDEEYNRGYDEGYGKAVASLSEEIGMRDSELDKLYNEFEAYKQTKTITISNFENSKNEYLNTIENDIKKIILSSCEKILRTKLSEDEIITNLLSNVFEELKNNETVLIKVNPSVLEKYQGFKEDLITRFPNLSIAFHEDLTLSEYGCVVETNSNQYDLQLSTQMNQIVDLLAELT